MIPRGRWWWWLASANLVIPGVMGKKVIDWQLAVLQQTWWYLDCVIIVGVGFRMLIG